MERIEEHKNAFEAEHLNKTEILQRIDDNAPVGVLAKKWTGLMETCPACNQKALDKFTGGANVTDGDVTHTAFLYHCRVCDLNLTEEQL